MAQFPVEYARKDSESLVEAINYALSGPSGLGQNFSGFSDSFTAWLRGNVRQPSTVAGYTTPAHGASTGTEITVSDPGSLRQNDANIPSKIAIGQYVYGTNIAAGALVSVDYDEINTPWIVPLTVANVGAVQGAVTFYNLPPAVLYVAPIAIGTIAWQDARTIIVTFATAQPTPPFELGTLPLIFGSAYYNGLYTGPGVVACTESTVTLQSAVDIANAGTSTGGSIKVSNTLQPPVVGVDPGFPGSVYWNTTDCASNVTVNGNLDRVFISAQINNTITYTATATTDLEYTVAINRYVAVPALTLTNTEFQYFYDQTVALQTYQYNISNSIGTTDTSSTGSAVTLSFDPLTSGLAPFAVSSSIVVSGVSPNIYNGTYTVTGCTANSVTFNSVAPYITGVAIAGTAGQFTCTASTLAVNQLVKISGLLTGGGVGNITGYTNPKTYYIIATNGSTTFTLSETLGGTALTTIAGLTTGLTFTIADPFVGGTITATSISNTLPIEETVFSNVIDNPGSAYYLYRVDLLFRVINDTGACEVTQSKLGNRNISVQVVKF